MTDWLAIIETEFTNNERARLDAFLERADGSDQDDDGYCAIHNYGGWTDSLDNRPVTPDHRAAFMVMLIGMRTAMNRRRAWDYVTGLVFGDVRKHVLLIIERETGMTDAEAFPPHLDPEKPEGKAVFDAEEAKHRALMARLAEERRLELEERAARAARIAARDEARRARRRPVPVRVADPSRQLALVLPFDRAGLQAHIEAHIRAWLPAGVPSPIADFLKVRHIRGGAAARVTLFDGEVTTVFAHGPLGHVAIRTPTAFFFHAQERRWVRAPKGLTREQAYADGLAV